MAAFVASGRREPVDLAPTWTREPAILLARQVVQEGVLLPAMRLVGALRVGGRERLEGLQPPLIIVANHSSHADVVALREAAPRAWRHDLVAAAAADYFFDGGARMVLSSLAFNTLPLERVDSPLRSMRTAIRVLRGGAALIVFPEGGRLDGDVALREFAPGVGFLARKAQVPVVPVCIWGTHAMLPKGRRLARKADVSVQFGAPLRIRDGEKAQEFTDRARAAVSAAAVEIGAWPLVYGGTTPPA